MPAEQLKKQNALRGVRRDQKTLSVDVCTGVRHVIEVDGANLAKVLSGRRKPRALSRVRLYLLLKEWQFMSPEYS